MTVMLTKEHQKLLEDAVARGEFASVDEAVTFAIDAWLSDGMKENGEDWLREAVDAARNDPRPSLSIDEAMKELDRRTALRRST
jgi:Arc/MetJ-type ribon-helix-helix transcriptional regulator